jgi:hypothetical protein
MQMNGQTCVYFMQKALCLVLTVAPSTTEETSVVVNMITLAVL